ncbi:hypothetical protein L798_09898 [Zootermopsis nevadensis]|uniref:Uncharacterized protein n=1 Tax=Zootermopsis nevadensis TaxID=136037 RepID=A0A067RCS8_ZOONE|nr:hypothetical protein L798_09898 [Zootermopsis nevadensis]
MTTGKDIMGRGAHQSKWKVPFHFKQSHGTPMKPYCISNANGGKTGKQLGMSVSCELSSHPVVQLYKKRCKAKKYFIKSVEHESCSYDMLHKIEEKGGESCTSSFVYSSSFS